MQKYITKRNITILNMVLLAVFAVTLIAVAVPYVKKDSSVISFSTSENRRTRVSSPTPRQDTYACPTHRAQTSNLPGKCPECGSTLEKLVLFAAISNRNLFDAHLKPPPPPVVVNVPPLKWELAGVTRINRKAVAVIRDKARRTRTGYQEYMVREGEEVPNYFGVKILSITDQPPSVTYNRPGIGDETLRMGDLTATPTKDPAGQWAGVIRVVTSTASRGATFVVKLPELQERVGSIDACIASLGVVPNMEGTRSTGLKIGSLPKENFLYAAGLRAGDVIKSINGVDTLDKLAAMDQLRAAGKRFSVSVVIERARTNRTLVYTLLKE